MADSGVREWHTPGRRGLIPLLVLGALLLVLLLTLRHLNQLGNPWGPAVLDFLVGAAVALMTLQLAQIELRRNTSFLQVRFDVLPSPFTHKGDSLVEVRFRLSNRGHHATAIASCSLHNSSYNREASALQPPQQADPYGLTPHVIQPGEVIELIATFHARIDRWIAADWESSELRIEPVIGRTLKVKLPSLRDDRLPYLGTVPEFHGAETLPIGWSPPKVRPKS